MIYYSVFYIYRMRKVAYWYKGVLYNERNFDNKPAVYIAISNF